MNFKPGDYVRRVKEFLDRTPILVIGVNDSRYYSERTIMFRKDEIVSHSDFGYELVTSIFREENV